MQKVLIVEDDTALQVAMRLVFELEGWEVVVVDNPHAAVEVIGQTKPDLLFTDLNFRTGGNGLELIQQIRQQYSDEQLPAVLCSGMLFDVDGLESKSKLARAIFFPKPFTADELTALIKKIFVKVVI